MPEISGVFVVCMGMGTVFVGLICIVLLIRLMSMMIGSKKDEPQTPSVPVATAPVSAASSPAPVGIPNREEFVAAVSAAIAEDLGTDVSKIQIISIKQI